MNLSYMRMAMEKDAASWGGLVRGIKSFASHPVKSIAKKVLWSRAPSWHEAGANVGREMGSGLKYTAGIAGAGILASPFFLRDKV